MILLVARPVAADGLDADFKGLNSKDSSAVMDDGPIRITPDQTKIVRLDQDAASVVVTNPDHASVILDSPRLLVVRPRQPGTTSCTVLNAKGDTIMEKTVIVASQARSKYVRVRRVCASQDSACVPVAYFYCPDGCYEVTPVAPGGEGQPVPAIASRSATTGATPEEAPIEENDAPTPDQPATEEPSGEAE